RHSPFTMALLLSRFFHAIGIYLSYEVLKIAPLLQFLFVVKLCCALLYVILQKPISSGRPIEKIEWYKITLHAVILVLLQWLYLIGMRLCGPLRTILVFENSDVVVLTVLSAVYSFNLRSKKLGVYLFVLALFSLLFFDNDDAINSNIENSDEQHNTILRYIVQSLSWIGLSDHKGGIVLLFIVLCMSIAHDSVLRKSAVEIGGAKRMNALVTAMEAAIISPLVLIQYLLNTVISWFTANFTYLFVIVLTTYVGSYYIKAIVTARSSAQFVAFISPLASFISALIVAYIWALPGLAFLPVRSATASSKDHAFSAGVILSVVCFSLGMIILSEALQQRNVKGQLIGFSEGGLPLYNAGMANNSSKRSFTSVMRNSIYQILGQSHTRRIFFYLCLNLAFTAVELLYGVLTNSLGLISDGFHMLFDSTALVIGLYAALVAKWKSTKSFSFGFGRVEVLSGFLNGIFLVVIAIFIFMEAIHRLIDPPEVRSERLVLVSFLGLLVNMVGIFSLRHSHFEAHGHSHDSNMHGVFLHVLADTLGSVGVIVSSLLIQTFGWLIADPICSLLISILIFMSVLPLLRQSISVLLLRVPFGHEQKLSNLLKQVLSVNGVISYQNPQFWRHSSDTIAGTLHVRAKMSANEQSIITRIHAIFKDLGIKYFTVQVEKDTYYKQISSPYNGSTG
ncbi:uncharacterized protein TRIADDRAFT_22061, partial [Trichoplax adhaerens]